jgi:hypothetical protein
MLYNALAEEVANHSEPSQLLDYIIHRLDLTRAGDCN